jgi:predicted CxxxxCH...CXXCH cytochrome family protein
VLPGHYHPQGYLAPNIHGRDMKLQVQDCRTCHGMDLNGGTAGAGGGTIAPPSCDSCHQAGWRTNCTYCHGTVSTGAGGGAGNPPRDLDGETDVSKISFPGHVAHVSGRIAPAFDCVQCHRKPTDVLSPYHAFDSSPRRGENTLVGGLSPLGVYDPTTKTCTNLYCHGNGRNSVGMMAVATKGPLTCNACHPDITTAARWPTMSGQHNRHLTEGGVNCTNCHAATVATDPLVVTGKDRHLNGKPDPAFSADSGNVAYDAATNKCTGTCHNKNHVSLSW